MSRRLIFLLVPLGMLLLAMTGCQPYEFKGAVLEPPKAISDFSLPAHDGSEFRLSDYEDRIVLIYFGYTSCPDVCPATLYQVKQAMEVLGDRAEQVQFVMITVDPERDTPERLADYLHNFNETFIGLRTTDLARLDEVLSQFGASYIIEEPESGQTEYSVTHTASVFLLDRGLLLREIFPYGTPGEDMASDIQHILKGQ